MRLVGSCAGRANGSTPGDQITGCTVDQATVAARCYARLHAAFWESPALSAPADAPESLSWVVEPTEPRWSELVSPFMQQHADGAFLEQDLPPLPPADGAGGAAVAAAAAAPRRLEVPPGTKEMLRKIAMHWDWLNAEMASSPRTLTHWCDKQRFYLVLLCCVCNFRCVCPEPVFVEMTVSRKPHSPFRFCRTGTRGRTISSSTR